MWHDDSEKDTSVELSRLAGVHGANVLLPDATLPDLFEARVARHPDALAVRCGGESLTYRELNQQANRLARLLVVHGIGPEDIVALAMPRTSALVVALIAVLKAGGAYLPLDPEHPAERRRFMMMDASPALILTIGMDEDLEGPPTVRLDLRTTRNLLAEQSDDDLDLIDRLRPLTPLNSAYILYTSGSTGRPKGVVGHHRGMVNRLAWFDAEVYAFGSGAPICAKSTLNFIDGSVEILGPLLYGGSIVLADTLTMNDPWALARLIVESGVGLVCAVPSLLDALLDTGDTIRAARCSVWISDGEVLSPSLAERLVTTFPNAKVLNFYGCTEVSSESLYAACNGSDVTIGTPIWNTTTYVLGPDLWPVEPGVVGELYIAGVGLARGYHYQPGLTSQRFIADPFGPSGGRMYRTGDLVRRRLDGALEFVSRTDHQVKVRGQRVELGEIEAALIRHDAVARAVVTVRFDRADITRLVAYIQPVAGAEVEIGALRQHLAGLLPGYMVPASWAMRSVFPQTPNGKIDRKALEAHPVDREPGRAPQNERDDVLCRIFADVLGVNGIGIDESFFDLGGHSLAAAKIVSMVRRSFGRHLDTRDVFDHPTVEELAALLDHAAPVDEIQPVSPSGRRIPLSPGQLGLWFLGELEGLSAAYNVALRLRFRGTLNLASLQQAVDDVVALHPILRTRYPSDDDGPYQQLLSTNDLVIDTPIQTVDVSEADTVVRLAASRPFDLASEIPLRALLVTTTSGDVHTLLLLAHHIAVDGWSESVLLRDLARCYRARLAGREPDKTPLRWSYADHALRLQQILGCETDSDSLYRRQLSYWVEQLDGLPLEIDLPRDRARGLEPTQGAGLIDVHVDPLSADRLRSLAREHHASPFIVLHAALVVLLTKLGAGTDVCIGTPVAGRNDDRTHELVGYFVNTLVLRTSTSESASFHETVRHVREVDLAALAHQDVPFERVVEALNPQRALCRHPLFQVMLVLQPDRKPLPEFPGVVTEFAVLANETTKFDLLFDLEDAGSGGFIGHLEFDTTQFDRSSAERIARSFEALLAEVVEHPDQVIGPIELPVTVNTDAIAGGEKAGALGENPANLVERWAVLAPRRSAVLDGDTRLDFRDLNRRAEVVARQLRRVGIGPECLVGVALPRSIPFVISLLAVLKVGGAYLPIEPDLPFARLCHILTEADPVLVITDDSIALPEGTRKATLADLEDETLAGEAGAVVLRGSVRPDTLSYVIYTSGSTGQPKGVGMTARGLANLISWQLHTLPTDARDTTALFTSIGFDVSVQEILTTLAAGNTLDIVPAEVRISGEHLARWLDARAVTTLFATTSVLRAIATAADEENIDLANLRRVFQAGEALRIDETLRRVGGRGHWSLSNHYGPAETHVATSHQLPVASTDWPGDASIGQAIPGVRIYVLDGWLCRVVAGVAGELYVAGAGVARGYYRQSALTASRFVADPFGPPGARMYRTGDRVRLQADGTLSYLGRTDDQVKIRGQRVEPAEIEVAITKYPGVRRAVVLAHHDGPSVIMLVAYLTLRSADELVVDDLREHLLSTLPNYMVPAVFEVLEEFPLSPNGKIDRSRLPTPSARHASGFRSPRSVREAVLCGLFENVLGVPNVGIDDDFFSLGGHSLSATRLISRIRSALSREVPLAALFRAPTVAQLARELPDSDTITKTLVRLPRPIHIPLSFSQQRLWFLNQLNGPSSAYNIPLCLRLTGPLLIVALRDALQDVVARHEILRTTLGDVRGEPYQHIHNDVEIELTTVPTSPSCLADDVRLIAAREFDLTRDLPMRAQLLELAPDDHVLILVLHHAAADGWSITPLLHDLAAAYSTRVEGDTPHWPALPVQYADYALWQRASLGSENEKTSSVHAQLDYWRSCLAGLPDEIALPGRRPRPYTLSDRGATVSLRIDPATHEHVRRLARTTNTTVYMVLQSALAGLLTRLGAGTDIPIGSAVAGRNDEALDGLIGFFVNTTLLRTDTSGHPTFTELVERVREADLEAFSRQDIPFECLVDLVNPPRSLARHPLFQVMLVLQNTPTPSPNFLGVNAVLSFPSHTPAKFDLSWNLTERYSAPNEPADGIVGEVEYSCDLFDEETVGTLVARFTRYLKAVLEQPDTPVDEIDVLSPVERIRILASGEHPVGIRETTCPELFRRQVDRRPEAIALVSEMGSWSYADLDVSANRLAHHLVSLGIGPDDVVALHLPRSPELPVAMLAIQKAGASYLPLDPDYPPDRLAFMTEDTQPALLLAVASTRATAPAGPPVLLLDDDHVRRHLARASTQDLTDFDRVRPLKPDHLAYVIYTSGSTGQPKAIAVPHRGLAALAVSQRDRLGVDESSRVLQFSTLSFDAMFWEFSMALLQGGTLVLANPDHLIPGPALASLMRQQAITHITTTPPTLALIEEARALGPDTTVIVTGDVCPIDLAERVSRSHRLINAYGPSEVTVCATLTDPVSGPRRLPLGQPMSDVRLRLLDSRLDLVPPGTVGELYVAGPGVTRGYRGQPRRTAERYVADPFGPSGQRMYRTGDLAYVDSDGDLQLVGRTDDQVKIRGVRVELGEIESAIQSVPGVRSCGVVAQEVDGDRRLVAHVVPNLPQAITANGLRKAMKRSFPGYMVPAAVVMRDELPLTPSGKLDRRKLPLHDFGQQHDGVPPRNLREEILSELFAEVLNVDMVGIEDDFFEQGGHSLSATKLVARLRTVLNVNLGVRELFEAPTVERLAARLSAVNTSGPRQLTRRDLAPEIPLSYSQQRLWFLQRMDENSATYNMPMLWRLTGRVDGDALERALNDVIDRHDTLRTTFGERDGEPFQVVHATLPITLHRARCNETELTELVVATTTAPFSLATDPPLRALLVELGEELHALLLVIHHIAADGWSRTILIQNLSEAYAARLDGTYPQWPRLPVRYGDVVMGQRERLADTDDSGALASGMSYWEQALSGLPEEILVPTDYPRPQRSDHCGRLFLFGVSGERQSRLHQVARTHDCTMFMVLATGLSVLLAKMGAGTDIPIGMPVAGREDPATHDMVGLFVNTLVLRTDLAGDPTLRETLQRVKNTSLDAYDHQNIPFEFLVEKLNPDRHQARHPLFQIALVLQNNTQKELELAKLNTVEENIDTGVSKFDLTFEFTERRTTDGSSLGIDGVIEFSTELFELATVKNLVARLLRIFDILTADTNLRLSEFDLLDEADRHYGVIHPATEHPGERNVVKEVKHWAQTQPRQPALLYKGTTLNYFELNARTDRLAQLLARHNIGPGDLVLVALSPSFLTVIAVLATLKTGAAYAVADPREISDHTAQTGDWEHLVGVSLVLTDLATTDKFARVRHLVLDTRSTATDMATCDWDRVHIEIHDDAPALMPSTADGRWPISHRELADWAHDCDSIIGARGDNVWALLHPFDTVVGAQEIWAPLVRGELVVILPGATTDHKALCSALTREPVTILWQSRAEAVELALRFVASSGQLIPHLRTVLVRTDVGAPLIPEAASAPVEFVEIITAPSQRMLRRREIEAGVIELLPSTPNQPPRVLDNWGREVPPGGVGWLEDHRAALAESPSSRVRRRLDNVLIPSCINKGPARDGHSEHSGPPRTPQESILCGLFSEVLRVPNVGIEDDFFAMGGYSLLAIRLLNRVQSAFGAEISITTLFNSPTIAKLATVIGTKDASNPLTPLLPLRTTGEGTPVFCVHPGLGFSWVYAPLLASLPSNCPVYGLQARALTQPDALPESIDAMAQDYLGLLRQRQPHGPYRILGWSFGGIVAHALAIHAQQEGEEVDLLAILDTYPPDAMRGFHDDVDQQVVRAMVFEEFGRRPDSFNGEISPVDVMNMLREEVTSLAQFDGFDINIMLRSAENNVRLIARHNPGLFEGNVRFFTATIDRPVGAPTCGHWRPYVSGVIRNHDVPVRHAHMTSPPALTIVGETLTAQLRTP